MLDNLKTNQLIVFWFVIISSSGFVSLCYILFNEICFNFVKKNNNKKAIRRDDASSCKITLLAKKPKFKFQTFATII